MRRQRGGGRRATGGGEASAPATQPADWTNLPTPALSLVMDVLNARDLGAAACVCRSWRVEAAHDGRWAALWQSDVVGCWPDGTSRQSMSWRWAQAAGCAREQLRARALVRHGTPAAAVVPYSRADGPVQEVLMQDLGPAGQVVVTVQGVRAPEHSVRLVGSTVKLWSVASLTGGAVRPLLIVHDVLKYLQLEQGQLFLWRIADDALVRVQAGACPSPGEAEEAARWAESESIVASVLDVTTAQLRDVPLEERYGVGATPSEFIDLSAGCLACARADPGPGPGPGRVVLRLLDCATGRCLREASCLRPPPANGMVPAEQLHQAYLMLTRNSEALACAALFDCRVWLLRLPSLPGQPAAQQQQQQQQQATPPQAAAQEQGAAAVPTAGAREAGGGGDALQAELREVFATPDSEPIVDVCMSTAARRIYVLGMMRLFLLDASGGPLCSVDMSVWRGVWPQQAVLQRVDVGAFSWPLPNSRRALFYLDICNGLFASDFELLDAEARADALRAGAEARADARACPTDVVLARDIVHGWPLGWCTVQAHSDLRSVPLAHHWRNRSMHSQDPVVVEYSQAGSAVFTVGETSCPTVARLLDLERSAGTYLPGLGPSPRLKGARPAVPGWGGAGAPLAPRAIVCIDAADGGRYRAIPIEGSVESLHSAGHYLVAAVSQLGGGGSAGVLRTASAMGSGFSDDEEFDDSFLAAVDQLVAQHKQASQRAPSEPPSSPLHQPAARPPPTTAGAAGGAPPLPPLQQLNGHVAAWHQPFPAQNGGPDGVHKRSLSGSAQLPTPRTSALATHAARPSDVPATATHAWPAPQAAAAAGGAAMPVVPAGPQAQPQLAQAQQERERLLQQLNQAEGQAKLLRSKLEQAEREKHGMIQRMQQLEAERRSVAPHDVFSVGEMQKQMDQLRQQKLFQDQETEELRKQLAERTERLRQAEAAAASLQSEAQAAEAARANLEQQLQLGLAAAAPPHAPGAGEASVGGAASDRARASGHKRMQSGGAARGVGDSTGLGGTAGEEAGVEPRGMLLEPGLIAGPASSAASLVAHLWTACSSKLGMLVSYCAAAGSAGGSGTVPGGTTALLLHVQPPSLPQLEARQFADLLARQLHQVACGMLAPTALLHSIAGMAVASLVRAHRASQQRDAAPEAAAAGGGGSGSAAGACGLVSPASDLVAAGLTVIAHLLEQDAECSARAAASCVPGASLDAPTLLPGLAASVALGPSSRVRFTPLPAAVPPLAIASLALPGTAAPPSLQPEEQHPAVFQGAGCGLLAIVVRAATVLGPACPIVLAGALHAACALAAALPAGRGRSALEPLLTSGAVQLFMQPPAQRLLVLQLLDLLLEDAQLAQVFEDGLAVAAAAAGTARVAGAGAGTRGGAAAAHEQQGAAGHNDRSPQQGSGTPPVQRQSREPQPQQPMQIDGVAEAVSGGWTGAAAVLERILDLLTADAAAVSPPASSSDGGGPGPAGSSSSSPGSSPGTWEVPRAAMRLAAMLRDRQQAGLLRAMLREDGITSAGSCHAMLAQRLVHLASAASAPRSSDALTTLLMPDLCPSAARGDAAGGNGSASLLAGQRAWQLRLRVAQEAATLLRSLLADEATAAAAMEDLTATPTAIRLALVTFGRLAHLEVPQASSACCLPPPLLAPWACTTGGGGGAAPGAGAACSAEQVAALARSLRRRVLHRVAPHP